jgi:hypothetical protein
MSIAGGCKMVLLAQADFDGELDAAQAAELPDLPVGPKGACGCARRLAP